MHICAPPCRLAASGCIAAAQQRATAALIRLYKLTLYHAADETIITWSDAEIGTDVALSFQEAGGCDTVWYASLRCKLVACLLLVLQQSTFSLVRALMCIGLSQCCYGLQGADTERAEAAQLQCTVFS